MTMSRSIETWRKACCIQIPKISCQNGRNRYNRPFISGKDSSYAHAPRSSLLERPQASRARSRQFTGSPFCLTLSLRVLVSFEWSERSPICAPNFSSSSDTPSGPSRARISFHRSSCRFWRRSIASVGLSPFKEKLNVSSGVESGVSPMAQRVRISEARPTRRTEDTVDRGLRGLLYTARDWKFLKGDCTRRVIPR
jgi:hypothetical protein